MSRRQAIRISLGVEGELHGLIGPQRTLRCLILDLSAGGARLAVGGRLPTPPLTLSFTLAGEALELPVTVWRVPADGDVALTFPRAAAERLHRLIAAEQRMAAASGRLNIVERRSPQTCRWGADGPAPLRGEVIPS